MDSALLFYFMATPLKESLSLHLISTLKSAGRAGWDSSSCFRFFAGDAFAPARQSAPKLK
jgi:hypothetical protein